MNRAYYRVDPSSRQPLFFTSIAYQPLQDLEGKPVNYTIDADTTIFLLTGIANSLPLVQHLKNNTAHIIHYNYPDHHRFSLKNISKLANDFAACTSQKKIIITTEKDAQRLGVRELAATVSQLPFLVIPIGISFLDNGQQNFDELVKKYVTEHREHHQIY
jgi:tetraacyldisaccharide 4'-kinase